MPRPVIAALPRSSRPSMRPTVTAPADAGNRARRCLGESPAATRMQRPMNLDALPYTSFIVLAEFCVGSLAVCVYAERRGRVAKSFVQFCAWMVVVGALVLLLNGLALDPNAIVGGYRLEDGLLRAVRIASAVFLALCLPYAVVTGREDGAPATAWAAPGLVSGAVLLGLTAYYVSLPTWGFAGMLLSILGGTLAVGAVVLAMTLGHWYLVTPRLPREPMEELTLIVLAAVALQALLLVINVFIPVRDAPDATAFLGSKTLEVNPAFWLR